MVDLSPDSKLGSALETLARVIFVVIALWALANASLVGALLAGIGAYFSKQRARDKQLRSLNEELPGQTLLVVGGALLALSVGFGSYSGYQMTADAEAQQVHDAEKTANAAAIQAKALQAKKARCTAELDVKSAEYTSLFNDAKFEEAAAVFKVCAETLNSPELRTKITTAENELDVRVIERSSSDLDDKTNALEQLTKRAPNLAAKYQAQVAKLVEAEAKRAREAERRVKKSQGVDIGMSPEDVYASSWGRPEKVNRTTTARGTHEQWVYGGHHSYLYFDNGVLTSIQN